MSQHDYDVANGSGAAVRADLNTLAAAIAGLNSGASAPSVTFAYMFWADTTNNLLKQRNAANSAWISILTLSTGTVINTPSGAIATSLLTTRGDIIYRDATVPARLAVGSSEQVLWTNGTDPSWAYVGSKGVFDFRLTLETGVPVSTTDQTAKTTLYVTPYIGNRISLYDGTRWNIRQSAEFSVSLSGLTSGLVYDVFIYDNAGTPTAELLAWTNATTRATALVRQDGILSKTGALTRRYAGSVVMSATGQSQIKFGSSAAGGGEAYIGIWNFYNRVLISGSVRDNTDSWTYNGTTIRSANNSATNRISYVNGILEEGIAADYSIRMSAASGSAGTISLAPDVTNAYGQHSASLYKSLYNNDATVTENNASAKYNTSALLGFHYLQAVESTFNSMVFFGDQGSTSQYMSLSYIWRY